MVALEGPGAAKRERRSDGPVLQYQDVTAASFRIRKGVRQTPLKVGSAYPEQSSTYLPIHLFCIEIGAAIRDAWNEHLLQERVYTAYGEVS